MEEENKLSQFLYNLIDAMFWVADETVRWWEIGKISIQLNQLRRQKAALNKIVKENELNSIAITVNQTVELTSLNESISKLSSKDDFIRSKCWALTPDILFSILFLLFFYGIITINPIQNVVDRHKTNIGVFAGQISRVRELPFQGHSIVSNSIWYNNMLYVAGNDGVTEIDTVSGQSQKLEGLPNDFYAKDMQIDGGRLIIAGYPGIFELSNGIVKPIFEEEKLPFKLINSFALTQKKQFLLGTLGHGILRSNGDTAVMIPNTQDYIVRSFGHQKKELWIMHDEGILTGNTNELSPLDLQVLSGKKPRCMITTDKNVFIGTDQGIVAGYRSSKNWVWTMLSSSKPGFINDITAAGDILFIASDEGVFRYFKGKMDRLSSIPTYSLSLCNTFLTAVGKTSLLLYYFDISYNIDNSSIFGAIPELGTYTPNVPVAAIPTETRPSYTKLPDYGLMDTDGKTAIAQSQLPLEIFTPDKKPMIELPIELQKPVFSDIISFNGKYYLATTNRGIWAFDGKNWSQVLHNENNAKTDRLCGNTRRCYAYGSGSGIFEIEGNLANQVIKAKETTNLKKLSLSEDDTLLLLYNNGQVKTFDNGELTPLFTIPNEFKESCHSVWKVANQFVAVLNQGVMTHESNGKWNLTFFQGNIDSARIADVNSPENKILYIAINDGRIFEFSKGKMLLFGIVPDHPITINHSGILWVSSKDSLFYKENNSFIAAPFKSSDRILGAFLEPTSESIYVFTSSGLRVLAKEGKDW